MAQKRAIGKKSATGKSKKSITRTPKKSATGKSKPSPKKKGQLAFEITTIKSISNFTKQC
jgi:hypothetical protein